MRRTVLYECCDFEITLRELLFSLIIVLCMMTMGFLISEKISSRADEKNQEYEQAAKIDGDKDLFEYAMRTNAGNAFVYGILKAEDPVSLPEIDGQYAYICKTRQEYRNHTRVVTDYDEDGTLCGTHEETYYSWDTVGHTEYSCTEISFLNHKFSYGTIPFPADQLIEEIMESNDVRYLYSVCSTEYEGTVYGRLADSTISKATFIKGMDINEAIEYKCSMSQVEVIIFWVIWIILIGGAVFGFCYLDNRWIED